MRLLVLPAALALFTACGGGEPTAESCAAFCPDAGTEAATEAPEQDSTRNFNLKDSKSLHACENTFQLGCFSANSYEYCYAWVLKCKDLCAAGEF